VTEPNQLALALSRAQSEFPLIGRSKTVSVRTKAGGTYTFAYAPLEAILAATKPVLAKHGLSVQQDSDESGAVWTIIRHASGDALRLAPVKIAPTESTPQAVGSALTYARRYSYCLALNLAADDDDDAGAAAGNETTTVKQTPINPVKNALEGEVLPPEEVESLKNLAAELVQIIEIDGNEKGGFLHLQEQKLDNVQKLYLWNVLSPNSKTRSALKREGDKARQ